MVNVVKPTIINNLHEFTMLKCDFLRGYNGNLAKQNGGPTVQPVKHGGFNSIAWVDHGYNEYLLGYQQHQQYEISEGFVST